MAGRLTLLILMTGLFASAWSSDRDPRPVARTAARSRRMAAAPIRHTPLRRWQAAGESGIAAANRGWTPIAAGTARRTGPRLIPAGTYLVVSPDGQSERVVIAASQGVDQHSIGPETDHFVLEIDGQRQHWIRTAEVKPVTDPRDAVAVWHVDRAERLKSPVRTQSLQRLFISLIQALKAAPRGESKPITAEHGESVNR